jgi:hypothetical protein
MMSEYPELDVHCHAILSKLMRIYRTTSPEQHFTEDSFGLYFCDTKFMIPNTADETQIDIHQEKTATKMFWDLLETSEGMSL